MKVKIPYLAKIRFFWCDSCHVPLIREKCCLCEKMGRKVPISPPGDIRPAFVDDLKRMVSVINSQFGEISALKFQKLIENQVILLNKVPYIDRMDEIIIQGEIVGVFRFNLVKGNFELLPRISLAKELWNNQSKGWVAVDDGARNPIVKGASTLSPGVVYADLDISVNDPVIVVCEDEVIAVGLAKMNGNQMGPPNRGVAIKTKYRKKSQIVQLKSVMMNWDRIINANLQSLEILEKKTIEFIELIASKFKTHVVAYSGGKDSLVTLDLVAQSNVFYEIIFSDTCLEYPETLENIRIVEQEYNKRVLTQKNESWDFWKRFDQFGPPSRNSRWCCKSAKLFPVNKILNDFFPDDRQVLSYIGTRRYESLGRSREPRVSQNPWIPKQVTAAPINNWNAFEVFLYINKHGLTKFLNPLYEKGFIRIGCWLCPASSLADFRIMKESHPSLFTKLDTRLQKIKEKHGLSEKYVNWGLWRWKYLPRKITNLLKAHNITYSDKKVSSLNEVNLGFYITKSPSICVQDGYSAHLSANQMLNLSRIQRLISIYGPNEYNKELDILSVTTKKQERVGIFRDGSIIIKHKNVSNLDKIITSLAKTVYRIMYCDGCGVCTYQCDRNALLVELGVIKVVEKQCTHCLSCNSSCPLIKYQSDDSYFIE
ncbi:MAG: phosphoadenosine phosphosulfate reductase domain-containing protein [Candidatus Hodarchaeales archaeon]